MQFPLCTEVKKGYTQVNGKIYKKCTSGTFMDYTTGNCTSKCNYYSKNN